MRIGHYSKFSCAVKPNRLFYWVWRNSTCQIQSPGYKEYRRDTDSPNPPEKEGELTLLSRKADYALLILSYLNDKPGGGTARAIADKFGDRKSVV